MARDRGTVDWTLAVLATTAELLAWGLFALPERPISAPPELLDVMSIVGIHLGGSVDVLGVVGSG